MNILVTGINGFVGKHVAAELKKQGHKVLGVGSQESPHPQIQNLVDGYFSCDLTNEKMVANLALDGVDAILGLAGLAGVGESFANPERYLNINVAVLSTLCKRLVSEKSNIRVVAVSSGAVYDPDQSLPLNEDSKITKNGSPYAMSKILMEKEIDRLRAEGLNCIVARPFNHCGPGQEKGFLIPDLYEKISKSMKDSQPVLVGDLTTRRDYTDVRDVARAYIDLLSKPSLSHNLFNVCSGKSLSGKEILDAIIEATGATKLEIVQDPGLSRPGDPKNLYGSYERLHEETDWVPTIPLEQTIFDIVSAK